MGNVTDNRRKLYNAVSKDYSDIGSWEEFNRKMDNEANRKKLYATVRNGYSDIGSWDDFNARMYQAPRQVSSQRTTTPQSSAPRTAPHKVAASPQRTVPKPAPYKSMADLIEASDPASPRNWQNQQGAKRKEAGETVQKMLYGKNYIAPSYGFETPQDQANRKKAMQEGYKRDAQVKTDATYQAKKTPAYQEMVALEARQKKGDKLSEKESNYIQEVRNAVDDYVNSSVSEAREETRRSIEGNQYYNRKAAQAQKYYGEPVEVGSKLVDGVNRKEYMLPDGTRTTDQSEVDAATKRAEEYRKQLQFDDELSRLWERHDNQDGENAAERAWSAAEQRQSEDRNRIAGEVYRDSGNAMSNATFLGGSENHIMNAAEMSHRSMAAHYTNFDLDRLMNESWNNLGEKGQKAVIDDCYQMLRHRYPGADKIEIYKEAKKLARQQSDLRLYNLAVEKNLPKGNLEYLMRKIGDMNLLMNVNKGLAVSSAKTTGDMAAYEAANEQYRQDGHKILDIAGTVAGFALDPTTWLSGGVGSATTKGAMWAGGRLLAGKGVTAAVTKATTRKFATSMAGRVFGGVAGGAVNFGTLEGAKEAENQFSHGGKVRTTDEEGNLLREGRYVNDGYSSGEIGKQTLHGLAMGGAIGWITPVSGNVSDHLVKATSSTTGKVATRAGIYSGATLAEGTIFSVPEWIEGKRDAFDVWTDNMAMMVGFKASHILKSAGGVLTDLKASFDSPANGRKNRLDFDSRLRMRMDAPSDGGLAMTKDEKAELKRYGYDNLRDLVESSERTGDPAEGSLIVQNAPEIVSRLTDMVTDPRVSEAARAKMYYYATGRRLPMSTVMRGELIEDSDGGFIVESQGANGVITSRRFKSRKSADLELDRIKRQAELNTIEIGERYQQIVDFDDRMQEASRRVAAKYGWDPVEVYRTYETIRDNSVRHGEPKELTDVRKNILGKIISEFEELKENKDLATEKRTAINEKYGVDIDGAIRKEGNRRTLQEQTAIDEYIAELIPEKAKEPTSIGGVETEDITNQKLLGQKPTSRQGQDLEERKPVGRAVMRYDGREVEVLSGRVVMTDDGTMVDKARSDKTVVIRDPVTGKPEMVAPGTIASYEEIIDGADEANGADMTEGDPSAAASAQSERVESGPKPVGKGVFGEIYDSFKGKAKDAVRWLFGKKSGEAKGVFHRDEVGDIGLIWGDDRGGLQHIIEKRVIEHSDYNSVEELTSAIEDVVSNGDFIIQKGGNLRFEKGGHRVIVAKNQEGDFVVTAYDNSRSLSEKRRTEADATLFRQRVLEEMNGTPVSPSSGSNGEVNAYPANKQAYSGAGAIPFGVNDSFRVGVSGRDESQPATVIDRDGENVIVWSPSPIVEGSKRGKTMPGYVSEISRADLEQLVERDAEGNPVDYAPGETDEANGADMPMEAEIAGEKQEEESNLSEEKDTFGKPFVKASDGSTTFGHLDEESGLPSLPIKLSLGENHTDEKGVNHGYGLLHINAGHGEQILNAGYSSIEEFVENVARNYTDVREGAIVADNQTYLLEVSDEHNNTLFIQLSRDGKYWNVNSAGIFKKKYSRRKPKVYTRPALGNGTDTDTNEVNSGQNKGATAPAGNSSETSDGKVNALSADKQADIEESSASALDRIPVDEKGKHDFGAVDADTAWDGLVEKYEGNTDRAQGFSANMVKIKEAALKKAEKAKSKPTEDPDEWDAAERARVEAVEQARRDLEHWRSVAGVEQRRQQTMRAEQVAEARRLAAERAEAERAEREAREEAARREREALEGIPEWHLDTPENARKRGVRRFGGQMFTRQEPMADFSSASASAQSERGGIAIGKEVEVKFSQSDLPKGHVAVIEASQLQPSHIQGQRNPMFFIEEAQPKNRAEGVSMNSAKEIAEGIRPQEITASATAYTGAPTVNTRGEVIQGNNRSDALRYLWENRLPEQQQAYKQYLIDNAEQFGLDPEAVNAMEQPVLVNMLDASDAEAIRLGQMTAQDTESGGVERIKPKNVAQKLGENMRMFASRLLNSGDEEASFGQLVDSNGIEVLKWMNQIGAISATQYQSAFDSKGNLTPEAKNDLQKVLYQSVFKGGSQQLEEMFEALPAKAQKSLLSTAFRDMDSPAAGQMLPEIQASIVAYNQLMSDPVFANARKMEGVLRAIEAFKQTIALDDRLEQYMPSDNFSNFALHLAGLYKASDMSQKTLTSYFNQMYDLAQGKKEASLFEEADTTQHPLAEVIKQVLGIDYKPAKNGNNNVANGGADVALRNQVGQGGELRGNEPPSGREQNPAGTEPSERGAGAAGDSREGGNAKERQNNLPKDEVTSAERTEMAARIVDWLSDENLSNALGKTRDEIFEEFGNELKPIAYIHSQFVSLVSPFIADPRIYCGKGYFIDHALRNHGAAGTQVTIEDVDVSKYLNIQAVLDNPDTVKETTVDGKRTVIFIKKIGRFFAELTQVEEDGKIVLHKSLFNQKKEPYAKLNDIRQKDTSSEGGTSSISHAENSAPAISLESRGDVKGKLVWKHADDVSTASDVADGLYSSQGNMSDLASEGTDAPQTNNVLFERKVNDSASDKQAAAAESFAQSSDREGEKSVQGAVEAASAEVNTEPTEAQKKAGNYKMGHVRIGEFDITIENPAGSVRSGKDADGKEWHTTMANAYGYIRGTESVDGDPLDVFLHSDMDQWNGRKVFVVDQTNPDGSFDEHKVMLGFNDKDEAMTAYLANYDKTWADTHPGLRISETNIEDFNKWIQSSHRKTKPFADYTTVSKVTDEADKTDKADSKLSGPKTDTLKLSSGIEPKGTERPINAATYDAAKGLLESAGIPVVEVSGAEAQQMIGQSGEDVQLMGSRTDRKMEKIAEHYAGKELDENQRAAVDVFSGKRDNVAIEVERPEGRKRVVVRQGREPKAGAKHSLFRHFETSSNYITADDIAMIPEIIAKGKRVVDGNRIAYDYTNDDNVRLRVTTEIGGRQEKLSNFLSNRKPLNDGTRRPLKGDTQSSAQASDSEVSDAKVSNKSENDKPKLMKTPSGTVYGWTVGGKVYLNRDAMDPETPLHEYTHLWDEMVQQENPELWARGKELMKQTAVWLEVLDDPNYSDIRDDEDAVASEVHSRLTGERGKKRIEEMISEALSEGDYVEKAKKISLIQELKDWLSDMFKSLKQTLGKWNKQDLDNLTADDFADMTLRDLAGGMNPRTEMHRGEQMRTVTRENPMLDDYHTGIRSREDVKSYDEILKEAESAHKEFGSLTYPDMDINMLREAGRTGMITVYSSKPIEPGNFVTPSRMNAEDYSGGGNIYTKRVPVGDVAWISEDEGQFAPVEENRDGKARMMAKRSRRRLSVTGRSLFDWADSESESQRLGKAQSEDGIAAVEADEALDSYAQAYSDYLDNLEAMESQLESGDDALRGELAEKMENEESELAEQRDRLREKLRDFYIRNNSPEDTANIVRDMVARVQAEVEIRHRKDLIIGDLLYSAAAKDEVAEKTDEATRADMADKAKDADKAETGKGTVKTAGGTISYEAQGHLPDAKKGEFAYVERQFSRTGEFSFTGQDRIKDRGDVAYLFRSLEDYSVENVFAVLVKDGKGKVLHIGMGTTKMSVADMGAIRAGYDAFGADKIYLVHNHPSGNLRASEPDRRLMQMLETAFEGKAETEGIIIDTTSGRYLTFDGKRGSQEYDRRQAGESASEAEVYHFNKADRSGMPSTLTSVRGAEDVKSYLENLRFGDSTKMSYLILSNSNHIIGNFHTDYSDMADSGLADEIASVASKYGGSSVIVYGNMGFSGISALRSGINDKSLGSIRLLDVVGVRGGVRESAMDAGMLSEDAAPYGSVSVHEPMVSTRGREEFEAMRERAVAERGLVMPGLNNASVRVVEVPRHDFTGTGKEALKAAEKWAKENIGGMHRATDSRGDSFEYSISNDAVEKYVSKSATGKSENIGVHLAALKKLPEIIGESVEAEVHPDYKKVNGIRSAESEINSESLVHRFYGAARIDGKPHRVKTTIREYADENMASVAHSYEVTEIELLEAPSDNANSTAEPLAMTSDSSISTAKLLQRVEKSYDPGKKLLEESVKADAMVESSPAKNGRTQDGLRHREEGGNFRMREGAAEPPAETASRSGETFEGKADATSIEAKGAHAVEMAQRLNTPIRVVRDVAELTNSDSRIQIQMRSSRGFYDPVSGEVVIVLPNHADVEDVAETVFHEVVAHKGLRELIGEENYDAFCDEVYTHLKDELKSEVDRETTHRFLQEPEKGYEHARRVAVDELFGRMAEKGFEDFTKAERGVWAKLKAKVLETINRFLGSLKLPKWVRLGDNELRYMLWRSHEKLRSRGDLVGKARDAAKRDELGLNKSDVIRESKRTESIDEINNRFNEQLKRWEAGEIRPEELLTAGNPIGVMRQFLPDISIVIRQKVLTKARKKHGLSAREMHNLPGALAKPIFIFKSNKETVSVLTTLKSDSGENLFVAVELGKDLQFGGRTMEVNDILTVHGREAENVILPIVDNNTLVWVDKEKGLEWLHSAKSNSQAITARTLDVAAKIVKSFENPPIVWEEKVEYRFRESETGDIWKDGSLGMDEKITSAVLRLSQKQSGDLALRNEAQEAIIDNLQTLLHEMRNRRGTTKSFIGADHKIEVGVGKAMSAQKRYDQSTAKRVSDLARILMQSGQMRDLTSGDVQRLVSAVKNAVGSKDAASVETVMDIMIGNQLRNGKSALQKLLSIRGSKVDARGVEVQGALDVDGQRMIKVVKGTMSLSEDEILKEMDDAMDRMGDPDQTIADDAAIRYGGLRFALDYVQNVKGSEAEEKALRKELENAKQEKDAGRMRDDAYRQFVEATEDAIRKNKVERAEAYFNLVGRLSDTLRESVANARAFRESEKARVSEIHHNANSDMEGRPSNEHHKDRWKDKLMNSSFMQILFSPLATFDQMLRVFGNKSANGEGYLWNRFMRGWVECRNKELEGVKEKFARLDAKAAEIFSSSPSASASAQKKKGNRVKSWGDLIKLERKLPKAIVSFWDGGEMRDHELTQGNLLYIYMVDKMTDGRMKLRKMGIDEAAMAEIEKVLDPRFKALGDWLQEEFLVDTRNEYNETHKRIFGASMAAIENYFPLKILANARTDKEEDVNLPNRPDGITTKTGSIIKRRVNNLALDITGADALSVILNHITEMEHWNAYAEWNRDLNTLRTYKHFRNQVLNMTTIYGGGRELWNKFNDLCLMAAGEFRPTVSKLNKSAVNLAKGVTAAKVSLRMYTALKQFLSASAYAPEVNIRSITKSIANPYGDFKWCLENMPIFRERWHSRISGDPRLLKSDMDWKMWRSRVMEISSRIGMTPNAFVDAVTVSIGARAMYETRLKQYLKEGYQTDAAEKRAMQDATILFNQTQQSSESPFLSTMQVDKDWFSTLFTVFRNSSMSYTRQEYDALRNLKRSLTPGQRAKSVEFMTKQILRDWDVDPDAATDAEREAATKAAKIRFRRQIRKDVIRLATFGFILELAWNLGPYLPYLIFGDDDDEKDKMLDDAMTHSYFGSFEGLTGGDVMSSFGNMAVSGEWNRRQLSKDMPLASDINSIFDKFMGSKNAEAVNDIANLMIQMGIGVNPQSLTDGVIALLDVCGDDPALSHEAAIFVMRVLQVPQSQLDKLYFDEVGLSGTEARKHSPIQLAQRYATYKVRRGTPFAPWSWDNEERLGKYEMTANTRMKERLKGQSEAGVNESLEAYDAEYTETGKRFEELKHEPDSLRRAVGLANLYDSPEWKRYKLYEKLPGKLDKMIKSWLSAPDAESAAREAESVIEYKGKIVEMLDSWEDESRSGELRKEAIGLVGDWEKREREREVSQ